MRREFANFFAFMFGVMIAFFCLLAPYSARAASLPVQNHGYIWEMYYGSISYGVFSTATSQCSDVTAGALVMFNESTGRSSDARYPLFSNGEWCTFDGGGLVNGIGVFAHDGSGGYSFSISPKAVPVAVGDVADYPVQTILSLCSAFLAFCIGWLASK